MNPPVDTCRAVLQRHSKSFALAARLLSKEQGDDVAALYAWCRRADDAVDLPDAEAPPRVALARLEHELDRLYGGLPLSDPVLSAFQRVVKSRRIPEEYPRALLRGLAMDVAGVRYATLEELLHYCFNVAGTVGLMSCHVFGLTDVRALERAAHLGIAMQLTNVSRDVLEDSRNGRFYLPELFLSTRHAGSRAIRGALAKLLDTAEQYYGSADQGMRALPWRAALAVRAARLLYSAIGRRIRANGYDVLRGRAVVTRARKVLLVGCALLLALLELPGRWFSRAAPAELPTVRFSDVVRL
jgi:15-cis-phytoene synthase